MKGKKRWLPILLLALCLTLCACGQEADPASSGSETPVALLGDLYDYDLSQYVALREYTGIHYKPVGDAGRSTVEMGDTVTVEIEARVDGVEEPITGVDTFIVGDSGFLEGFDEGLVGHDINDTITMALAFPEDYGDEELAGKAVDLTAYILLLDLSQYRDMNESALWQIVLDESTVLQYPEKELTEYTQDFRELYETVADRGHMTLAEYAQAYLQITEEELPERCRADAEAAVKEDMVLWAIWRDAGLSLTEGDLENCRQLWLQTYGYESEADMPAPWDDASVAQSLQRLAVERKVKTLLLQSAVEE